MVENKKMPNGWEIVKTDLIGNLLRGISYKKGDAINEPKEGYLPILRANNINGELNFSDLVYVPKKYIEDYQIIKAGDIVFAMSSGSKHLVGKSAVAKNNFDGSYGAFCSLLRINDLINKKYIAYIFKGNSYRKLISEIAKGTNINNLKREHILDFEISLPPLPEQNCIVAKIEELFSSLDKGIESLKTAQQQLKVYRQAVLKWAFEGLKNEKEVEEITYDHSIGLVRSNNQQNAKGMGLPYIKMNNIDLNGNVDFTKVVYVEVNKDEAEKYALRKGDILINTRNSVELVGKTGIVREEKPSGVFNNNLLRIRTKSEYNPLFIGYQLISPWLRKQMLKEKKATTNVCALYQRDIFPLKVKVTDSKKQDAIVAEIESRLSVCDKIEESIEESLKQAEALRQSILKKAFEGKLVPQDPKDEPAGVLLERIRAERLFRQTQDKNKPMHKARNRKEK